MWREIEKKLLAWKERKRRKPLVLSGIRQCGKTYSLRFFGKEKFSSCVYFSFEAQPGLASIFAQDFDTGRILRELSGISGMPITEGETLLVFDEVQEAPRVLTSLKYFCEEKPDLHIACAGSLLGTSIRRERFSFPVGKVNFIDLHPMTFHEFLLAIGEQPLAEALARCDWTAVDIFSERLTHYLKTYYFTGGMPEAVATFVQTKDYVQVRQVQSEIIRDYENDFSKHVPPTLISRLFMVWQSIPSQLDKENKKFIYGIIREGARAKDFELAIQWLVECGLLLPCRRVKEPRIPLIAYQELSVFKLFLLDVGLLAAMAGLDQHTLLRGNSLFTEFKGALTEQYVMQQLHAHEFDYVGYWTNERSTAEVDFLVQTHGTVIPVEVKAEDNVRAKSFRLFCEKFNPAQAVRISMRPYKNEAWMENIPLYAVEAFFWHGKGKPSIITSLFQPPRLH